MNRVRLGTYTVAALLLPLALLAGCGDDSSSTAPAIEQALGQISVSRSGGSSSVFDSITLTLSIEVPTVAARIASLEIASQVLTVDEIGTTIELSQLDGWDVAVATLTNGEDDFVTIAATVPSGSGGSSTSRESTMFGGGFTGDLDPDFAGYTVTRLILKVRSVVFNTPGENPNSNGIWTDYFVDGYIVVMGRKN